MKPATVDGETGTAAVLGRTGKPGDRRGQHWSNVSGFHFGHNMTETKLDEISRAIDNGADEIDVVWNVSAFKSGVLKIEIARCSALAHDHQKLLKVIIETSYLSEPEIEQACKICADAGADFVKTSTGFVPGGAIAEHIALMKKALPRHVGIKASGEIKTLSGAKALFEAGAQCIGTSSGVSIAKQPTLKIKK